VALLPSVATEDDLRAVGRDEAALRPGLERLAARLGVGVAGLTRYPAGSRPVYASGDLVLKLFPPVAGWPSYRIEAVPEPAT
jgi:hygromycin-B 7''-O-kinase